MNAVTFVVVGCPPWKQGAAAKKERDRQKALTQALRDVVAASASPKLMSGPCALQVHYTRSSGAADAANIFGGVADALEGLVYENDRCLVALSYSERQGKRDEYVVTVTELGG